MKQTLFCQSVSHDFVPQGSHCEWCGKEAVQHLTALGGLHHNQGGRFCLSCGRVFIHIVSIHPPCREDIIPLKQEAFSWVK